MEIIAGCYYTETRIKSDATPIDNITKFAWYDDDYEEVEVWHEYTAEELAQIAEREAAQAKAEQREVFLENAPTRMTDVEMSILDHDEVLVATYELNSLNTSTNAQTKTSSTHLNRIISKSYARLIEANRMTIEDVPEQIRDLVKELLNAE